MDSVGEGSSYRDRAASPRVTGIVVVLGAACCAMDQTNPANSRATATQTLLACTPRLDSCANRDGVDAVQCPRGRYDRLEAPALDCLL